jgi:hypothetical protein
MESEAPLPQPAEFKTRTDGRGGLIAVTLVGGPHDGHVLYIDELDLPASIYTTGAGRPFEWWPAAIHDHMATTAAGSDPEAPPVEYILRVPDDTREPLLISADKAR